MNAHEETTASERWRRERRARASIDADEVDDRLWQGSLPPEGPVVAEAGFTLLVLCAEELQPPSAAFPGVRVLHAPNDDAPSLTAAQRRTAREAARAVAAELDCGGRVLVTCAAGYNRSGLVNGLAMALRTGAGRDGPSIVAQLRARREWALCNEHFADLVRDAAARLRRRA